MSAGPSEFEQRAARLWSAASRRLVATYPLHRTAFIAINVMITALNIYQGKPWWGVWPLLITGVIFTIHFLIYRAVTVEDAWVDERAADLYDKSYDQGHIDAIAEQYGMRSIGQHKPIAAAKRLPVEGPAEDRKAIPREPSPPDPEPRTIDEQKS